jgi:hypothetical protein
LVSILPPAKNIALGCENEIWTDRECEISESGLEQINGTARINRPDRAGALQFANQLHALRVENWFANSRHQRSVEIDAEQFDSRMH